MFRLYEEHAQKMEYNCLIHEDFDHAWAEHYPITLMWSNSLCMCTSQGEEESSYALAWVMHVWVWYNGYI